MGSGIPIKFCRVLKIREAGFELLRRNLPFGLSRGGITFVGKISLTIKPIVQVT